MSLIILYGLLGLGLALYAAAFLFETVMSVMRLGTSKRELYPHAGWEISHTTLVIVFTIFIISHGPYLPDISKLIFIPFFIAMIGFFIRATVQVYIFFGRTKTTAHSWVDHLFAASHFVILLPFLYSIGLVVYYLLTHDITPLTSMLGWFVPGLIAGIAVTVIPVVYVMRSKY